MANGKGIRACFKCVKVEDYGPQGSEVVTFSAATTGPDNVAWSKYTPAGSLSMTIDNPAARGVFKAGEFYYLDFMPVEIVKTDG